MGIDDIVGILKQLAVAGLARREGSMRLGQGGGPFRDPRFQLSVYPLQPRGDPASNDEQEVMS
jgi:hypothetical protein